MCHTINTVTGTINSNALGPALMHEHIFVEYGGPTPACCTPGPTFNQILSVCTHYVEALKKYGIACLVDPTTVDLGRNVLLMSELSDRTGITIICATGMYSTAAYMKARERLGGKEAVTDLFIKELTEGIDNTGIKAGIIKVVTGSVITALEKELILAAAGASVATGVPIITHTEGVLGQDQQALIGGAGVPLHQIIIGHSCLSTRFDYHMDIVKNGSYIAFDRFGMPGMPDEVRAGSLLKLLDAGFTSQVMVSHDSVWYWIDGPEIGKGQYKNWVPTNIFKRIIPMLQYGGVRDDQIQRILRDNPQRYFSGEAPEQ